MEKDELKEILNQHILWLNSDRRKGKRADLSRMNFRGANLSFAYLTHAFLYNSDFRGADLSGADLSGANLINANLFGADLINANLDNINFNQATIGLAPVCPMEGSFIAYKKVQNYIVVLEIPADARRSSATTYQCRCDKAKVLRIEHFDGSPAGSSRVCSNYDVNFVYVLGETVYADYFDTNRWVECSNGIYFFMSRDLAEMY